VGFVGVLLGCRDSMVYFLGCWSGVALGFVGALSELESFLGVFRRS
jgi:hypothetical protein